MKERKFLEEVLEQEGRVMQDFLFKRKKVVLIFF